jgi:hypothetical protein
MADTYFAPTAGKARYLALLDIRDVLPDCSFSDLRVKSLGIIETPRERAERQAAEWNAAHGPGTPIRVYGLFEDEKTAFDTIAKEPGAYVLANHVVIKVPGDCYLVSHVKIRTPAQAEGGAA